MVGFEPTTRFQVTIFKTAALNQTQPHFLSLEWVTGLEPAWRGFAILCLTIQLHTHTIWCLMMESNHRNCRVKTEFYHWTNEASHSHAIILKHTVQILVMASVGQSMCFNMDPHLSTEDPKSGSVDCILLISLYTVYKGECLVRIEGLEPPRFSARTSKDCMATNYIISALVEVERFELPTNSVWRSCTTAVLHYHNEIHFSLFGRCRGTASKCISLWPVLRESNSHLLVRSQP